MRYVLGLDIGIASVGWAVLALDSNDEPYKIEALNSRIFSQAENPKTGESLALPRRSARGSRRRLRRRRHRLDRIIRLMNSIGLASTDDIARIYGSPLDTDVYQLRCRGLDQLLAADEWVRVLIHIAKHRGFKSNRKSATVAGEDGKVLTAVNSNREILAKYRTVGEMFCKDKKFAAKKRNTADSYILCVSRSMLQDEIKQLFCKQREFGNTFASEAFEEKYIEIFASQRSFEEGPGGKSPYGGDQIAKMIGLCTFERENGEKRAPKAAYSFMKFSLLQKVNHICVKTNSDSRSLTDEERKLIIELAWKSPNVTYASIRKAISLPYDWKFNDIYYKFEAGVSAEELIDKNEKGRKFNFVAPYHEMRKALDKVKKGRIAELSEDNINDIAYIFSVYRTDTKLRNALADANIDEKDIDALLNNMGTFSKFGHLSIKACKKINAFLEEGLTYDKACEKAGYDFKGHNGEKTLLLTANCDEIKEIPNPVVKRALSQTIKVINAIVRKYGSPVEVHIELARDMARTFQDRKKAEKSMQTNSAANDAIKKRLQNEFGIYQPSGMDIMKLKLYEEQKGICLYSQKVMDIERVVKDGKYAEVDHILPYSRSFDDSMANKVLVLTSENQHKRNRTPMEYLQDDPVRLHRFVENAKSVVHNPRKLANLLKENFNPQVMKEWKERNLTDAKYISRFIYNFLNDHLLLADGKRKRRILAVNGVITAYIRKRLGINKIREDGDLHHAVDAVVIASITQGVIARATKYSQWQEVFRHNSSPDKQIIDYETGEILTGDSFKEFVDSRFPEPWPMFRKELEARAGKNPRYELEHLNLSTYSPEEIENIKPAFVSRMPTRKVTGSVHDETIRSPKLRDEGLSIVKTDLTKLKLTKDGSAIADYYKPESDKLLYEALLNRLQKYDGKADKAFAGDFYKPKADGTMGPLVKKVKTMSASTLNVGVNGGKGIANNGGMVRVDVFYIPEGKEKGYYLVPIYIADVKKEKLPSKAIVAQKSYNQWKEMDDCYFMFSLYPNDLIYIEKNDDIKLSLVKQYEGKSSLQKNIVDKHHGYYYYRKTGINTASISIIDADNVYTIPSLGVKGLKLLRKCEVDIFGNITLVGKEKRTDFSAMRK